MFNEEVKNKLKVKIVEVVATTGRTPVVEIINACSEIADVRGPYNFDMTDRPNAILWPDLSEELVAALRELIEEGRIVPLPVFRDLDLVVVVFSTGVMPKLPIATELPQRGFDVPTWIPTVFAIPDAKLVAAMDRERQRQAV